jgi:hypothetical protein
MAIWTLDDREGKKKGEVLVIDEADRSSLSKVRKWMVYSTPKVELRLLQEMHKAKVPAFDEHDEPVLDERGRHAFTEMPVPKKTVGYLFKYDYKKSYAKFSTFNSFGIVYSKKERVPKEDVRLNIIYEDKIIRLLAYEHKNKIKDYWLIGRWRSDSSGIEEVRKPCL